jgi:hypothetical protein
MDLNFSTCTYEKGTGKQPGDFGRWECKADWQIECYTYYTVYKNAEKILQY